MYSYSLRTGSARSGSASIPLALCLALMLAQGCAGPKNDSALGAVGEWPQFRGPDGLSVSDAHPLPTTWSDESPNIRWKTILPGVGNSSPVVSEGRVFLTGIDQATPVEASDGEAGTDGDDTGDDKSPEILTRWAMALDLESGELLWHTPIYAAPGEEGHFLNTNVAPTPVTDGKDVWAYFGSHLARLDRDGNLLWVNEVDASYVDFVRYGIASSPVLVGDLVILVQDREWSETDDVGWLAAYHRDTGELVWRNEWSDNCCSYSTPLIWQRGERTELVFAHSAAVIGYEPTTGEKLWGFEHRFFQFVSGLSVQGDIVCALGGAHRNKGNLCLRVIDEGESTRVEEVWSESRRAPETASPVIYRGNIYAITESGVMSSYDVLSGEERWFGRVKGSKGFRGSLVAGDGKIYASSTWGVTAVIDADAPKLKVLALNTLAAPGNNATPAIAGGCLLMRTADSLLCIGAEEAADQAPASAESD